MHDSQGASSCSLSAYSTSLERVRGVWRHEYLQMLLKEPLSDAHLTEQWNNSVVWSPEMLEFTASSPSSRRGSRDPSLQPLDFAELLRDVPAPSSATPQPNHETIAPGADMYNALQPFPEDNQPAGPEVALVQQSANVSIPTLKQMLQQVMHRSSHPGQNGLEHVPVERDLLSLSNCSCNSQCVSPSCLHTHACCAFWASIHLLSRQHLCIVKLMCLAHWQQSVLQAMESHSFTDRHFWRPRAPGVSVFNTGDSAAHMLCMSSWFCAPSKDKCLC